jgi:diguanylate cyclase (GGDEF)-like protein/PAS domain S-box-containing protein
MKKPMLYQEQLFSSVLNYIHDGIIALDPELVIIYMNPAAERMSALSGRDIRGCSIYQIFSLIEPRNLSPLLPMIFAEPGGNRRNTVTVGREKLASFKDAILESRQGVTLLVEGNISYFSITAGGPPGYIIVFRDITERKRLSALAEYRSHHDLLTGLSNREGLTMQLKEMIRDLKNTDSKHVLLDLEIDRFGEIINGAGPPETEKLLKRFAEILRSQIQQKDIAARFSADTFILALRDCSIRDAIHVAGRINVAVSNHVFKYQDLEFSLSVSIGVVALSGRKKNIETLLRSARTACNCAKQEEGSRIFCFT